MIFLTIDKPIPILTATSLIDASILTVKAPALVPTKQIYFFLDFSNSLILEYKCIKGYNLRTGQRENIDLSHYLEDFLNIL